MLGKAHQDVETISIITAVYNHQDTIADTLDSILMQETSHRFHVYCLDDASTDRSGKILAEYQSRYPDCISIYTSAENQGSGKRSFLHHRPPVKGRYWCLLAGDDYWTTADKLEKQVTLLERTPEAVGCSTNTIVLNEQTGEESVIEPQKQRFNLMDFLVGHYSLYVHPSGLLWRNIYLGKGFFLPPAYIENDVSGDTILLHMMLADGGEIINLPEISSCYRMTGRGVWSQLSQQEKDTANEKMDKMLHLMTPLRYRAALKVKKNPKLSWLSKHLPKPING